jgi:hypothetical protein
MLQLCQMVINKIYSCVPNQNFEFCGEEVPLYDEEVKESFDKELYINVFAILLQV